MSAAIPLKSLIDWLNVAAIFLRYFISLSKEKVTSNTTQDFAILSALSWWKFLMILIVNRQTDTHMATLYCIFSFIRRRSIQQQKYMKKREREKRITKLECWQLTCQFPTRRSPVLCSFDRDNSMYEQQTWMLTLGLLNRNTGCQCCSVRCSSISERHLGFSKSWKF